MYSLRRISLSNWYLIDAKDIDIRGEAALIGPTGAGKTSIQDAIQTVITGASQNRLNLNASASGRSSRSVLEYCLGMTGDPAENGRPLRPSCETLLVLTFANDQTGEPIAVGLAMAARQGEAREEILSRFIAPGHAFSLEAVRRSAGGVETVMPWAEIAAGLRETCSAFAEYKASAEKFTAEMLSAMRAPPPRPTRDTSCAPFPTRSPSVRSSTPPCSCATSSWSPTRSTSSACARRSPPGASWKG